MKYRFLISDDEKLDRETISRILNETSLDIDTLDHAGNVKTAVRKASELKYDMFFIDWIFPDGSGIDILRSIYKGLNSEAKIFFVSSMPDSYMRFEIDKAMDSKVLDKIWFIDKPIIEKYFRSQLFNSL